MEMEKGLNPKMTERLFDNTKNKKNVTSQSIRFEDFSTYRWLDKKSSDLFSLLENSKNVRSASEITYGDTPGD